ncbi:MAG: orotidine 5'-phosphate decarboxylase [Candidatus Veblenbacteria bacterium RIFOXYD1_FULL_43_11]|uniref:Orotidine-5'-phosphate decarboxylase n=1 Tax=Candidatus Veblenbacteria bacterium RIFOXYD1_FULL_43_11 TaxID=1802429 RepID=A0A1G2Q953_9BACT|nr:MAG: orotidine 5'-phosphate decarboxylase [Candidatus Veblenbacteria bacterium RIFOXYD1_FULL_43_11]
METRNFQELVANSWQNGLYGCLGLDPDVSKIPACVKGSGVIGRIYQFLTDIIDESKDVVGFFKPNLAFFERYGSTGIQTLKELICRINIVAPRKPIILDAKKNEIGNSNLGYVDFVFNYLGVDAVTVNPYLGLLALKPFFQKKEKSIIVLCRTSNEESDEFQGQRVELTKRLKEEITIYSPSAQSFLGEFDETIPLYLVVAHRAHVYNKTFHNVGLVTGATYPEDLKPIRQIAGSMPFLLPGIGVQSKTGDLEADLRAVLENGFYQPEGNVIINVARAALYRSQSDDYAPKCRDYFVNFNGIINTWRASL